MCVCGVCVCMCVCVCVCVGGGGGGGGGGGMSCLPYIILPAAGRMKLCQVNTNGRTSI